MKGLKRHPCLKPLSRDHLIALMAAQKLMKAGNEEIDMKEGVKFFLDSWEKEISVHLQDEERILPEFITDERHQRRLLKDHTELRRFAELLTQQYEHGNPTTLVVLAAGEFLDKHVRWEEHELFPHIENTASPDQIERLLALTDQVEASRNRKTGGQTNDDCTKQNNC